MKRKKRKRKNIQEYLQEELNREIHCQFSIVPFMEKKKRKIAKRKRDLSSGI